MNITEFSDNVQTQQFIAWLGERIAGDATLDFTHAAGQFDTLSDARDAYEWPPRKKTISTPKRELILTRNSSLAANQKVLDQLCDGLRDCLAASTPDEELLAAWVQSILVWGGVYTRHKNGGGNAGWLSARRAAKDLAAHLREALEALESGSVTFDRGPSTLRSNAGLTKVYSLAADDFIIYDSRVAAALAWLVMEWSREAIHVPDHLKFACMRANEGSPKDKAPGSAKVRSPNVADFPYFAPASHLRDHRRHAVWNLRANCVLAAALVRAKALRPGAPDSKFQTVRDVEAALFVMGADLRHALD